MSGAEDDFDAEISAGDAALEPAEEQALAEALRSAWDPAPLDPRRHAELLGQALEDPFAPPTADELRESQRLRRALEAGDDRHPDAALARALGAAARPVAPSAVTTASALGALRVSRPNVVFVSFGAAALAAAAAIALFVTQTRPDIASHEANAALLRSRSTSELFDESFEPGEASERIDRIASARERDLRENRYALWGAR